MASTQIKPNKLLKELLQEEQEPFILEAYLLERGYVNKTLKSENSSKCCHDKPTMFLKKSASCNLQRSKKNVPNSSKVLKSVYNKLVLINKSLRIKNCDDKHGEEVSVSEIPRNSKDAGESERFSSASSTTVYNSCPESDEEEESTSFRDQDHTSDTSDNLKSCNIRKDEAPTDRKPQRRCLKESKKRSPLALLEKTSHEGPKLNNIGSCDNPEEKARTQEENPSLSRVFKPKKVTEDSILSASLWELLVRSTTEKPGCIQVAELRELVHSNVSSQFFRSKRVVQQNKQLLFDCVREVVENNGRKESRGREFLGSEEIGKLICEKINEWGRQSGDETNINRLLNLDFQDSVEEWSDFEPQKREFAMAIGDAILEELGNELVIDMINSFGNNRMLSRSQFN